MQQPFSVDEFTQNLGGDPEMALMLLKLFVETADGVFQELHTQPDESYRTLWQRQLHLLRGSSLNIGADEFSAALEAAEVKAFQMRISEFPEALQELERRYAFVRQFIGEQIKKAET